MAVYSQYFTFTSHPDGPMSLTMGFLLAIHLPGGPCDGLAVENHINDAPNDTHGL